MRALIVYYMVQRLNFPDERAALVWGAASAGLQWLREWRLGGRPSSARTMLLGAVHRLRVDVVPGDNPCGSCSALGVIVVGGLFKANTGNLVPRSAR